MISKRTSAKLNIMSFIATVLVVCIHVPVTHEVCFSFLFEDMFGQKIPLVAVPCFFAISGFLLASHLSKTGGGIVPN